MNLTKTAISLILPTGTYPIYYCDITERYFIKPFKRLLEVRYERRKWRQTGVQLPIKAKAVQI